MEELTRRRLLGRAAAGAAALTMPGLAEAGAVAARDSKIVPMPGAGALRRDVQRMVDMGPRYTGTAGHNEFINWLERELADAGMIMLPRDHEPLTVWEASDYGLELLSGPSAGTAKVAAYYPRSQETGPGGVTGPLVYGGTLPIPSLGGDIGSVPAALAAYPAALTTWAQGILGTISGGTQGSIMLVDVPMPAPLLAGAFLPIATFVNWEGHTEADFATSDYKRPWIAPGASGVPTAPFASLGAIGCVFILDVPYEALNGNYIPFENGFEGLPALFVDRETGAQLRAAAGSRPQARLVLDAERRDDTAPELIGYLPGATRPEEALFVDTHTDGEGFVEENGGIGMVHLARHFASLPKAERLNRTLVFSLWPGHMTTGMPQLEGVIDKHPDIIRASAAGITMEHLGCTEWIDNAADGYHATGEAELLGVWTTQGKVFEIVRDQTVAHNVPRAALLRPPVQFGVGAALQSAGVPQVGYLAGPYYLLRDSADGDMDKFDGALAAKQLRWTRDILRDLDGVPAAELASGDPTLGQKSDGPKATFPDAKLGLSATIGHVAHLARTGELKPSITVARPARIRVHARLITRHGHVELGSRLIWMAKAGTVHPTFDLSRHARRTIARAKRPGAHRAWIGLSAEAAGRRVKVRRRIPRRVRRRAT